MKKSLFLSLFLLVLFCGCKSSKPATLNFSFSSEFNPSDSLAVIKGNLKDGVDSTNLIFASVTLYKDGSLITGRETDLDGHFNFKNISPSFYSIEASYVGFYTKRIDGIQIKKGEILTIDILLDQGIIIEMGCPIDYIVPLIQQDETTSGATFTSDQIKTMAW